MIPADDLGLRVLLIEDNPGDARLVRELLDEQDGFVESVDWFQTLSEGTDALRRGAYDIVIMDLSLPDSSGVAGVQQIRDAAFSLPVVVLSGGGDEATAIAAVKEGAQDYLLKGTVNGQSLQRALRYAVHRFEQMRMIAFYDSLTGLENRALFLQNLDLTLDQAKRYGRTVGLLFIDLDGFKDVNDRLGHESGDEVLRTVAQRLRSCVRKSDIVARLGGDEFTILLPALPEAGQASRVAENVITCVREAIPLSAAHATISASVGIGLFPTDASNAGELLRAADEAMYNAKRGGKNRFERYGKPVS